MDAKREAKLSRSQYRKTVRRIYARFRCLFRPQHLDKSCARDEYCECFFWPQTWIHGEIMPCAYPEIVGGSLNRWVDKEKRRYRSPGRMSQRPLATSEFVGSDPSVRNLNRRRPLR